MSQATAYVVSAQLLARDDFQAACRARDFGEMFTLMRKYDGASQDKICSPVDGLTQSRVSKIMRGVENVAALDLVERIVDALRIPGAYVGLATRQWEIEEAAALTPVVEPVATAVRTSAPAPVNGATALRSVPQLVPDLVADQPSPSSVRIERPVGLRPHLEHAFEQDAVTVDFAGFSGETLAGAIGEPLDKVRSGELTPSSIRFRILVPDTSRPWAFPCRIDDLDDDPAFRRRAASIIDRSLSGILDSVAELKDMGAVSEATAEVRVHGLAPTFKLYLINGREAFFGFYPVTEHNVRVQGTLHAMYDVMGKDSVLFHHTIASDDADPTGQFAVQARIWFESVWASVARGYVRD